MDERITIYLCEDCESIMRIIEETDEHIKMVCPKCVEDDDYDF